MACTGVDPAITGELPEERAGQKGCLSRTGRHVHVTQHMSGAHTCERKRGGTAESGLHRPAFRPRVDSLSLSVRDAMEPRERMEMSELESAKSPFVALPAKIDLGELDRRVIKWWQANDVFARSLDRTTDGPSWVFYEGPPTANGTPGTHHVEARVFKDVLPRYR